MKRWSSYVLVLLVIGLVGCRHKVPDRNITLGPEYGYEEAIDGSFQLWVGTNQQESVPISRICPPDYVCQIQKTGSTWLIQRIHK